MNTISKFVFKLGMMDRFGYTYVHAAIDALIIAAIIALIA
jgi:hypothetical protein